MGRWVFFVVVVPSIILHEVSHGWVAYLCGDPTAKEQKRLTLNPLRHIDPFGTILMPLLLAAIGLPAFGYAKPVPVNIRRLRHPREQALWVGLAGPLVNIFLSAIAYVLCRYLILSNHWGSFASPVYSIPFQLCLGLGLVNLWLAAFNLLPIPPLDGSAVIEWLLPRSAIPAYYQFRARAMPFMFLVVMLLFFFTDIGSSWVTHIENWWIGLLPSPPV